MGRKSNSRRAAAIVAVAAVVLVAGHRTLSACPFCTALKPSLAQQRDQAAIVALGEVRSQAADNRASLRLHKVLKGENHLPGATTLDAALDVAVKPGGLVLLFANDAEPGAPRTWHAVPVNEASYAYFARAPRLAQATAERLRYFGPYLEHAEPLVAEDAYLEFGHAPFDEVARVANILPPEQLRRWLIDPAVPPHRKGFYGLAIGLRAIGDQRAATAEFLRGLIEKPDDDFRAGFDGVLGGYLLLAGDDGLKLIERRYLANPLAADGDVRHALTALRFYHEYGHDIPIQRLSQALASLLARGEFADAAITDLARWQAWELLDAVVAVYSNADATERSRRAVVGYLLACPGERARGALNELRALDPEGVAAAEQVLARTSSVPSGQ